MTNQLLFGLSPLLILAIGALLLMVIEAVSRFRDESQASPSDALAGTTTMVLLSSGAAAIGVLLYGPANIKGLAQLGPYLVFDHLSLFFFIILALGGSLTSLLAGGYFPEHQIDRGEFYPLVLFATFGAMVLAASGDLLTIFIGLETMSLSVYAMIAFRRNSPRAVEAALKYFLLGSFAAALMLYGGALLYGATGHTDLAGIGYQISHTDLRLAHPGPNAPQDTVIQAYQDMTPLVIVGFFLMLVGLVFKVSAVPFHMWTPDAYEGAPTPTSSFMAVAVKTAAFALTLRVLFMAFGDRHMSSWGTGWPAVLAVLAVLTMTVANVIASRQDSVKRMLAYSSVAHAGYLLIGVIAATQQPERAQGSILFYLLVYTVSTAGAFGTLILAGSRGAEAVSYEDLSGIGRRHPAVALAFSLFLLSLAGVPPLAGFFGKFYLFRVAIDSGYVTLAIIGLLNSVVAAYYYLKVMVYMYMREPEPGAPVAKPMSSGYVATALLLAAFLVLLLGLLPDSTLQTAVVASLP